MVDFKSVFQAELQDFLAMRKASMSDSTFKHDRHYLSSFDSYLASSNLHDKTISEATISGWVKTINGKSSSKANEVIVIRMFIRYLQSLGYSVHIPVVPKVANDYIPHIFTDEELSRIFDAADNLKLHKSQANLFLKLEFPVILRLLYGCGLRIGETLALQMKDIDLNGGILTLLHTKLDKQRLVPMSTSMNGIMRSYCLAMGIVGQPDAWVFPNFDRSKPVTVHSIRNKFDLLLKNIGLDPTSRNLHERGPCMHCFRHVFAFKSFAQGEQQIGRSLDDSVPFLSIYLGHDSLNETDKYLKFSSELYPESLDLFDRYTENVFPEVAL